MNSLLSLSKEYEKSANILLNRINLLKSKEKLILNKDIERRIELLKIQYYYVINTAKYLKNYYKK